MLLSAFEGSSYKLFNHSNATDVAGIQISNVFIVKSPSKIVDFPVHFSNNSNQHASLLSLFLASSPGYC